MDNKKTNTKQILFAVLAIVGFLIILLSCIRLQAKGIPILAGLVIHTCAMLLLYYNALSSMEAEEWEDEDDWLEDVAQNNAFLAEWSSAADTAMFPSRLKEDAFAKERAASESPSQQPDSNNQEETEKTFFKDVYAEVRDILIASPAKPEGASQENTEPASDAVLPASQTEDGTAAEIPNSLQTFLAGSKNIVEMDIIEAAKNAIESLRSFAEKQNIKLHLSTTCETLLMHADPDSIRILFRNIIDNSIKYMGRPGHMIITISLLGNDIFMILKDTGMGLSEEETTHVFELNFQGSNRVSGNGLGLTQTKTIVEAFGGTIYAKSSPGNGMAIYIQLPVSSTAPSAASAI